MIRNYFDKKIKTIGVRNCYYPLFISRENLEREQDHVEGFSAEVAWVERGGKTKLEKPTKQQCTRTSRTRSTAIAISHSSEM